MRRQEEEATRGGISDRDGTISDEKESDTREGVIEKISQRREEEMIADSARAEETFRPQLTSTPGQR